MDNGPKNNPTVVRPPRGKSTSGADFDAAALGARLKSARRRKMATMAVLADAAGLDKGYLSRIERGLKAPSIATLMKLAHALGVGLSELVGQKLRRDDVSVMRASDRVRLLDGEGVDKPLEVLLPVTSGMSLASFVYYPPDEAADPSFVDHHGDELAFVISGRISVEIVDRQITLQAGDAVSFASGLKHRMKKLGDEVAAVLVVISTSK